MYTVCCVYTFVGKQLSNMHISAISICIVYVTCYTSYTIYLRYVYSIYNIHMLCTSIHHNITYIPYIHMLYIQVGKLLDVMDKYDGWRNTVVILTADHGKSRVGCIWVYVGVEYIYTAYYYMFCVYMYCYNIDLYAIFYGIL